MFQSNIAIQKARKREITVEPILWTYAVSKQGKHAVKLKVTFNRSSKFFPIQYDSHNLFLSVEEWELLHSPKAKGEVKLIKAAIDNFRFKANTVIEKILSDGVPFTFDRFRNTLFLKETSSDFLTTFHEYQQRLLSDERYGTYRCYECALRALNRFLGNRTRLSPYDVTVQFLHDFERFLKVEREASVTTIGIYMRTLRTIYNLCAMKDSNLKELYPFGSSRKGKYQVKSSRNGPKHGDALTLEQMRIFVDTTPDPASPAYEAKMYWLFSFYCQGMNFKDICFLRYQNIVGRVIRYTRQKTKRTEENEILEIPINDTIKEIIVRLGNEDKSPTNYVFPILDASQKDGFKIEKDVLQKIKVTNHWLKRLCRDNGLPEITTYWSRHTYASLLKYSGVSVDMIRELLGHSDIRTTEHYLKRFDLVARKAVNEQLFGYLSQK